MLRLTACRAAWVAAALAVVAGSCTPAPRPSSTPAATASSSATFSSPQTPPGTPPAWTPSAEPAAVLIGAGDICRLDYINRARSTAALIEAEIEADPEIMVFTLGDNSNQQGTAAQYANCFDVTWGAFKSRIRPTVGNHDQYTENGAPYYAYFGPAGAGPAGKGYYSYDAGPYWHVVVLNAICSKAGGCGRGSPQETWLKADLAANADKHIIAMWHAPEFSSGGHGSTTTYITWWRDLYAAHAEIVLSGHDHDYERFARQSPTGAADRNGIRQFVVGTGGAAHSPLLWRRPNSEAWNSLTYGVLKLTLKPHSYRWEFLPVAGSTFTDSGETPTHG